MDSGPLLTRRRVDILEKYSLNIRNIRLVGGVTRTPLRARGPGAQGPKPWGRLAGHGALEAAGRQPTFWRVRGSEPPATAPFVSAAGRPLGSLN